MNEGNETSLAGLSVLVLDDETLLRRRITAHLEALDYLVKPFDPGLLPLVMRRERQARQSSRVAAGEFREDLLHRLDLFRVNLPSLRERGQDILTLTEKLITSLCRQHRLPRQQITEAGRRRWSGQNSRPAIQQWFSCDSACNLAGSSRKSHKISRSG